METPSEPAPSEARSRLLQRLARLGVSIGPRQPVGPGQARKSATTALDLETVVPGRWLENESGRCYVSSALRSAADQHGNERLSAALDADGSSLALLARDPALAGLDVATMAFLDTETTGLSGGTGTYAFLIGVGRVRGSSYEARQFFMAGPSQGRGQLAGRDAGVAHCSGRVSFKRPPVRWPGRGGCSRGPRRASGRRRLGRRLCRCLLRGRLVFGLLLLRAIGSPPGSGAGS